MPSWTESITAEQWRTLAAAALGWMLDAFDVMLYAFALTAIRSEFGLNTAQAGALASVTLLASAAGGILFGALADRIGRARCLVLSILVYSAFTALTATATSVAWLVLWRALVGIGLGGEWSAGSVLVAETWPAEHRGKAIGLMQSGWAVGYAAASLVSAAVLPRWGWRSLFALGVAPAVLTLWIRRRVPEPAIWREASRRPAPGARILFAPPLFSRVAVATGLAASLLFAYWGLFTWVPTYLASPLASGGAGLGIVRSSIWVVTMQAGAFAGYASFGFFADRFGRRPTVRAFVTCAAVLVPVYGLAARSEGVLLALGPFVGFFGHGYFSVFGAMLAELFPSAIRGTAQGLCYNAGRAASAAAPFTIGALADAWGLGTALAFTSAFFLVGAALISWLPETRGGELP
jgi:MFS family permease